MPIPSKAGEPAIDDFKVRLCKPMTTQELDTACRELQEELQAEMDAYDERIALQAIDDGKTTTERAVEALQHRERFPGERAVARSWLREYAPGTKVFYRVVDDEP